MPALLTLWVAAALGAETVIADHGMADDALARVRPHTAAELRAVHIEELRTARPAVLGQGAVLECASDPVSVDAVRDRVYAATGALLYMEYGRASVELESGLAVAPCARGGGLGPHLAELHYVQGVVHALDGDEAAAIDAFVRARGLGLTTFNTDLGAAGQQAFEAAGQAVVDEVAVSILAPERVEPVRIDGRAVTGSTSLSVGPHVLELDDDSVLFELVALRDGPSEATLVMPGAFAPTSLLWAADPERRGELSTLLAAVLGEGAPVWVLAEAQVWHGTAGRTDWNALPAPERRRSAADSPWRSDRRRSPLALGSLVGGGVLAVAGGVAAVSLVGVAKQADADRVAAPSVDAYDLAERRYRQAGTGIVVGRSVAVAGGALAALGLTLTVVR